MKMVSEVCRITGVTRKALRGYEKEGLVQATTKTHDEDGYRLYDDEAVFTILVVKMLMEAGYKRKEIKRMFEDPNTNNIKICEGAICKLEKQKKHIDGLIYFFKNQKLSAEYFQKKAYSTTEHAQKRENSVVQESVFPKLFPGDNIIPKIQNMVDYQGELLADEEFKKFNFIAPYIMVILDAIVLRDMEPTSISVQTAISDIYDYLKLDYANSMMKINEKTGECADFKAQEFAKEFIVEFVNDIDIKEEITKNFGGEAYDYLLLAVHAFIENRTSDNGTKENN